MSPPSQQGPADIYALQKFSAIKQAYMTFGRDTRIKKWKIPIQELGVTLIQEPEEDNIDLELTEQDIAMLEANLHNNSQLSHETDMQE